MEKDAADWQRLNGGETAYLELYLRAAERAGFTADRDVYMASGLFSYADPEDLTWLNNTLGHMARRLIYKELFVPPIDLIGLNTEQLALVDFLVLAKSEIFVGIGSSTFSVYLRWVPNPLNNRLHLSWHDANIYSYQGVSEAPWPYQEER